MIICDLKYSPVIWNVIVKLIYNTVILFNIEISVIMTRLKGMDVPQDVLEQTVWNCLLGDSVLCYLKICK